MRWETPEVTRDKGGKTPRRKIKEKDGTKDDPSVSSDVS